MLTAFVLVTTTADRIPEVAQDIADIPGVSEVYSVTGEWNLVAVARVQQHDELAGVIADRLSKVDGVVGTNTMIAFRSYGRQDLDAAFALGVE